MRSHADHRPDSPDGSQPPAPSGRTDGETRCADDLNASTAGVVVASYGQEALLRFLDASDQVDA